MSGISKKIPLPHWRKVMDKPGWQTATDAARAAKLSPQTAHNAIYGDRINPSNDTVLKLCRAAGVDPRVILKDIFEYALRRQRTKHGAVPQHKK